MSYCLITPTNDFWLFETDTTDLIYNLVLRPMQIGNLEKFHSLVDRNGNLHLYLLNQSKQAFHAVWNHYSWRKKPLSFTEWNAVLTYVDSANIPYLLIQNTSGIYISSSTDEAEFSEIELSANSAYDCPLFFTVDKSKVSIYWLNQNRSILSMTTISRENGKLVSEDVITKSNRYLILKHWVLDDSIILILQDSFVQTNLYIKKISPTANRYWEEQFSSTDFLESTDFYLLTQYSSYLLLISTPGNLHYTHSFNAGEKWAYPQASSLFAPAAFHEILSVNNIPSSFISVKKIKGCTLQHPLIMNLHELYSIIQSSDEITYKGTQTVTNTILGAGNDQKEMRNKLPKIHKRAPD